MWTGICNSVELYARCIDKPLACFCFAAAVASSPPLVGVRDQAVLSPAASRIFVPLRAG